MIMVCFKEGGCLVIMGCFKEGVLGTRFVEQV